MIKNCILFLGDDGKEIRIPTPIVEDPDEDRILSPVPSNAESISRVSSPVPRSSIDASSSISDPIIVSSPDGSIVPSSSSPMQELPSSSPSQDTIDASVPILDLSDASDQETGEKDKCDAEIEAIEKKSDTSASIKISVPLVSILKTPEPAQRSVTPTSDRGKSKTTGKTISGWL